ncbi:hypothetical protein [Polyangium jinanense]|uniref:Dickkopf N-terminal cysteine-rich domain-containing protein n=1 Tax=Polyangium jinanense TaxID=2829994 RepID=A0A9X3XHH9_9BACT|nr:hypothetical protein [Polyangium jinanense]MDC3961131.1 hypothetical protein [Polyangium jinanense]MDC3989470.1 hypothetical protein [Polyangium jinanense]
MIFQRPLSRLLLTLPTLAATFVLGLAACGDDTDGTTPPPKYTLDNVCAQIAPQLCEVRKTCCEKGDGYDEAACITYETEVCEKNVADVQAGLMTFDGNSIDACLVAMKPYADKCFLTIPDYYNAPEDLAPCSKVFAGKLTDGSTCERDAQCASSVEKREIVECDDDTKKCSATRFLPLDAACKVEANAKEVCDQGLYCDYDFLAMEGLCKPAKKLGEACTPSPIQLSCGLNAYCDADTKVCTEAKVEGSACQSPLECQSLKCNAMACGPIDPLFDGEQCKGSSAP